MRDVNRIDEFLEEIGKVWKDNPDLRFGQIVSTMGKISVNLFNMEEEEFLIAFKNLLEGDK